MNEKLKNIFSVLINVVSAIYPVLFFIFLIILKIPIRLFSLFIIALALFEFVIKFLKRKNEKNPAASFLNSIFLFIIGVLCFIINTNTVFKFYPMLINIILLYTFGITFFQPPVMIYRFAILVDKSIPGSQGEKQIASYCYKVTVIWCVFFILNGIMAALTALFASDFIWFMYNSVISGILTGTIFVCEYIVRKIVQRKLPK